MRTYSEYAIIKKTVKGEFMAKQEKSGFCKMCDRQVVVSRPGTNHILHLLLSILTAGLWLIVWIGSAIKFGGWRCSTCGNAKISNVH